MAKHAPRPTSAGAATAPPRRHSLIWLQGLVCGAVVTLATPTALLLSVLLAPVGVIMLFDRQPGRARVRTVALCAMAGSVTPLRLLWTTGHTMATATALVTDTGTVAIAWSAAAVGWLLSELLPLALRAVLEALSLSRAAQLRATRTHLIAAWGLESDEAG